MEGCILDADGKGIAGVPVDLQPSDLATGRQLFGARSEVITDRNGRYRQVGVLAGAYRLRVMPPDAARVETDAFVVEPGTRCERDVTLH